MFMREYMVYRGLCQIAKYAKLPTFNFKTGVHEDMHKKDIVWVQSPRPSFVKPGQIWKRVNFECPHTKEDDGRFWILIDEVNPATTGEIKMNIKDVTYENGFPADLDKSKEFFIFVPDKGIKSIGQPCIMYHSRKTGKWRRSYLKPNLSEPGMHTFNKEDKLTKKDRLGEITQHDLDKLADLSWWLKGYEVATDANFENCHFDGSHLESLEKTQRLLKWLLSDSEETEIPF